jgi:methionine-rich copper-binding protein CopC
MGPGVRVIKAMRSRAHVAAFAAVATALVAPGVASAHTDLLGTTPADGARLTEAPPAVVVRYSAPLGAVDGATVTVGGEAVGGTPRLSPRDAARLVIPLRAGGRSGDFRVQWEVRSADGHALTGRATFTIPELPAQAIAARVARQVLRAAAGLHAAVRGI